MDQGVTLRVAEYPKDTTRDSKVAGCDAPVQHNEVVRLEMTSPREV